MRLSTRMRKLEAAAPGCDGRVTRIARGAEPLTAADRCRRYGGCHVLVIEEEIVESREEAGGRSNEGASGGES